MSEVFPQWYDKKPLKDDANAVGFTRRLSSILGRATSKKPRPGRAGVIVDVSKQIGVLYPQDEWWIFMENPIKMGWFGG